jgi:hypothetical protein
VDASDDRLPCVGASDGDGATAVLEVFKVNGRQSNDEIVVADVVAAVAREAALQVCVRAIRRCEDECCRKGTHTRSRGRRDRSL